MKKHRYAKAATALMALMLVGPNVFIAVTSLVPGSLAATRCAEWVAQVVSVQGTVEAQGAGATSWHAVRLHDTFCLGDMIRVRKHSRAAIIFRNESIFRLDQETTVTFTKPQTASTFWLDLLSGVAYFFSRAPKSLTVTTPYVNAGVEGMEFGLCRKFWCADASGWG